MSERKSIIPDSMKIISERFHYSPGVLAGNVLYIAGQVGRTDDLKVIQDPEAQYEKAFENLGKVLTTAGADFTDVVELVTYHTEMRDLALFMKVKDRFFKKDFPAWSALGTTALAMPGLQVEIKATAVLRK